MNKLCCLSYKGDAQNFFPFYFIDVLQMQKIILANVDKHVFLLLRIELAYHLLGYLSGESLLKDSVVKFKNSSGDISDKEKSIAFYLVCFFYTRVTMPVISPQLKKFQ